MDLRSSSKGGAGRREPVPAPVTPAKAEAVRSRTTSDTSTNLLLGLPAELLLATLRLLDSAADLAALACAAPCLRAAVEVGRNTSTTNSPPSSTWR